MPPKIHVVAGILFNERGEFLLSSRPEGKPYAGYWEFAGGKVEAGESEFAALQREFMEELGVEILHATPWLAKFYRYEHAHVNLRFFRVAAHEWRGTLQAREQQQWAWQKAGDFTVSPMLPANTALLAQL
ncbi:MAG: NUDIX domain-containing protein, partial [Kingella oralis]